MQNRRSRFFTHRSGRSPTVAINLPRSRGRVKAASPDQALHGAGTAKPVKPVFVADVVNLLI